jgi:hypothetical protein
MGARRKAPAGCGGGGGGGACEGAARGAARAGAAARAPARVRAPRLVRAQRRPPGARGLPPQLARRALEEGEMARAGCDTERTLVGGCENETPRRGKKKQQ